VTNRAEGQATFRKRRPEKDSESHSRVLNDFGTAFPATDHTFDPDNPFFARYHANHDKRIFENETETSQDRELKKISLDDRMIRFSRFGNRSNRKTARELLDIFACLRTVDSKTTY
jgi:hypothetical protein